MQEQPTPEKRAGDIPAPIVQHVNINKDQPLRRRFTSRKFWAMIAGAVLGVVGEELGWDRETIAAIIALAMAYIAGASYVDGRNNNG